MVRQHAVSVSKLTKTIFVIFVATLLQSVAAQHVRIFDVVPEILLATSALIGLTVGEREGVFLGFICGCVADLLFLNTPFMLSAVTFAFVAYVCGLFKGTIVHGVPGLTFFVTAIASMIGILIFVTISALFGYGEFFNIRLPLVIFLVGILNGLFALILGPLVHWALAESDVPQLRLVKE